MEAEPAVVVREGLDAIRHTKRLYFREGEPTGFELVEFVMLDVHRAKVANAHYQRVGDIYSVSSSEDWFAGTGRTVPELFAGLNYAPPPPRNSWRAEAMLAAFSSGVFTAGTLGNFAWNLEEAELPEPIGATIRTGARLLAWRFRLNGTNE